MSLTAQAWQEFLTSPQWKEIEEYLAFIEGRVITNICDNNVLHSEGRDNFPEIKFERGKLYAIRFMKMLPQVMISRVQEGVNDGRYTEQISGTGRSK